MESDDLKALRAEIAALREELAAVRSVVARIPPPGYGVTAQGCFYQLHGSQVGGWAQNAINWPTNPQANYSNHG